MDLFEEKNISPMLIKDEVEAFNDPDYIYELKFDGIRALPFWMPQTAQQNFLINVKCR